MNATLLLLLTPGLLATPPMGLLHGGQCLAHQGSILKSAGSEAVLRLEVEGEGEAAVVADTLHASLAAEAVIQELHQAASELDPTGFAGELAPNLAYVFGGAVLEGAAAVEEHYRAMWAPLQSGNFQVESIDVHVHDQDAATVVVRTSVRTRTHEQPEEAHGGSFAFAAVIERRDQCWQIVQMAISTPP